MARADSDLVDAYLDRIGISAGARSAPDLTLLRQVHHAHQQRFVYTNLDIVLGRAPSIDPATCLRRAIATGRLGYCFHQNQALWLVLTTLGYRVTRRAGTDWKDQKPSAPPVDADQVSHLALFVDGLVTPEHPSGRWWVDVGLGEGFLDPLPLGSGTVRDGALTFALSGERWRRWRRGHRRPWGVGGSLGPAQRSERIVHRHADLG